MKQERNKIPVPQQYKTFPNTSKPLRLASQNSERPRILNIANSDISELKQCQKKLIEGQNKVVSELSKLSKSIDNLANKIGTLIEKNNGNGHDFKKDSLNQSLSSNYSKSSSGTVYYRRRDLDKTIDKKEERSEQNKEKTERKIVQIVQNCDKYVKIKKNNK